MEFTKAQQQVIEHSAGPCLVLAVPGAGKTTVLMERIHRMVQSGIPAHTIASITFSKRQAIDMKNRYETRFCSANGLYFSTIHAFCYRILRRVAQRDRTPLSLLEASSEYTKKSVVFHIIRSIRSKAVEEETVDDFLRIDGYLKNSLCDYATFRKQTGENFPQFEKISNAYSHFKKERGLIDFDDMLVQTLALFATRPEILEDLRHTFQHLQVDEAQDTSPLQLEIIRKLASPRNNILLVADDDQAIYGFRGANPIELLRFSHHYPHGKIITMQDNHRSTQNIVRMSAHFIRHNEQRFDKTPSTDSQEDHRVQILFSKSVDAQYRRLLRDLPDDLNQGSCAILYRNNLSAVALSDRLLRAGISFRNDGVTPEFYRSPVLTDILDILESAAHPTDITPFSRIYYKLGCYLKKEFIQQAASMNPFDDVIDRMADCDGTSTPFYREQLDHLRAEWRALRRLPPMQAIQRIELSTGYGDYLDERARFRGKSNISDRRILEVLKEIARGISSLDELRAHLETLKMKHHGTPDATLILSTIHGAKGLEFDTVWVLDLIENEFPSASSLQSHADGNNSLLEEERRLFYVAMTRAKKHLRLVGRTPDYAKGAMCQFLRELTERNKKRK